MSNRGQRGAGAVRGQRAGHGRGASRGRGRGRGGGFLPFGGQGQTLGGIESAFDDGYYSPRGGRGGPRGGRPFPARGRGGRLAAQGQNQVGFDYSSMSRGRRLGGDEGNSQEQADDFSIEPRKGYMHKHKPHLEYPTTPSGLRTPQQASTPKHHDPLIAAVIPTAPQAGPPSYPSRQFQQRYKNNIPTVYPEFRTSRGLGGRGNRPPEETQDAKYLSGVPSLRGKEQKGKGYSRHGDPAEDNPLRKPLVFVQAIGDWKDGKFIPFDKTKQADTDVDAANEHQANQSLDKAMEEAVHAFALGNKRPKHAGLGFARLHPQSAPVEEQAPAYQPTEMDLDEEDQVANLLKAFPGSKELRPDEAFVANFPGTTLQFAGSMFPSFVGTTQAFAAPAPKSASQFAASMFPAFVGANQSFTPPAHQEESDLSSDSPMDDEAYESQSETQGEDAGEPVLEATMEEMRLPEPVPGSDSPATQPGSPFIIDLKGDSPEHDATEPTEADPFVFDLEGETSKKDTSQFKKHVHRVALGDSVEDDISDDDDEDEINWTQRQPRGQGKKARNAAKKARRRAKAKQVDNLVVHGMPKSKHCVPREGDSDLEWGSDGPPGQEYMDDSDQDELALATAGITFKDVSALDVKMPTTANEEELHFRRAIQASIQTGKSTLAGKQPNKSNKVGAPRSNGPRSAAAKAKNVHQAAIMSDYMENIMAQQDEDDSEERNFSEGEVIEQTTLEELLPNNATSKGKGKARPLADKLDEKTEMDAMIRFMNGMDPQKEGRQKSLRDIAIEAAMNEEDDWMTEGSGDSDAESKPDVPQAESRDSGSKLEEALDEAERHMVDSDDEKLSEQLRKILESEDSDSDDSEDDEDSDDDNNMFAGNFSWAEEDEAFIVKLTQSMGSGHKAQKKLFKTIEKGEFDVDFGEEDLDDPAMGVVPAKRGKEKGKNWKKDDLWADELLLQWEKDRVGKAANKKKRQLERQAAALNPFPGTHKKGKKARRAARREEKVKNKSSGWSDEEIMHGFGGSGRKSPELATRFATNLSEFDEQILLFLKDATRTTLTLPPMDKRSRAQVHMLADAYLLKSKSKGNGHHRFPTLIKTSRSGLVIDGKKVRRILLGNGRGSFGLEGGAKDFNNRGKKSRNTVGATGGGAMAPKNREGEEVGWGAQKIGAENIGHKLLAAMGWSEGMGIGMSGGISDPVAATVKVTKGGLGW